MAIPDFQSIMLPLLKFLGDEQEHSKRESVEALAKEFHLTNEEMNELLSSGQQAVFDNRVGWARTYMKKAGLVESTRRGFFRITQDGLEVLKKNPEAIDIKFLDQFPGFKEFRQVKRVKKGQEPVFIGRDDEQTPEELLESGYQKIRQDLIQELLGQIKQCSPIFFERLVVELLVKMGYGGSRQDAGKAVGRSGDEGIDGMIKEDRLGLDVIYIQAKRWDATIGRPEIQKFVGALQGQRAKKGIFITTADFSNEAIQYASSIDCKIVLVDGEQLAQLMIDFNLGVSKIAFYEIKKVNSDYFTEE
jgi:restriction system protein